VAQVSGRVCGQRTPLGTHWTVPLPHAAAALIGKPSRHVTYNLMFHPTFATLLGQGGGEAYIDAKPSWGGFLSSGSSSAGGSSGSSSQDGGSPVTRLLAAAADHVRAAPLPGAAAPWLVLPLLPVVLWCVGW
jgi:hypothetical protein